MFRESWSDMTVRTVSPNECVYLTNHADRSIEITCDNSWFQRTDLGSFTEQLNRLFRLAFIDRTKLYNRQKEMITGHQIVPIDASRSPHMASFVEKRDSLAIEGVSRDGLVQITSVGLSRFVVTIDGPLWSQRDRLAVERSLSEAATAAVGDQFSKMLELKREGH